MKTYEVIHEIFNQCPGNHSRDNFIQEIDMESPEIWLNAKFRSEKELRMEKTEKEDGSVQNIFAGEVSVRGIYGYT